MRIANILFLSCAAAALAQDTGPQRVTMPFSDPAAPKKLEVNLVMGGVTVRGYDGREATVEYSARGPVRVRRNGKEAESAPAGMQRLGGSGGLDVTESNNVVRVSNAGMMPSGDVVIQVPVQTSVTVKTMTGGQLTVENISGEIEAQNMNGQVNINNVSGSVVAHSMNGKVVVALNRVDPGKDMNFSTFNGDVEVTLPADTKARLKMRTDNGDIFADTGFDIKMENPPAPAVQQDAKDKIKGRRRVRVDGTVYGTLNGGGPEMQFTTFNGRILLHKK